MAHKGLRLDMPATYRIRIQGFLNESWSDRLGGVTVVVLAVNFLSVIFSGAEVNLLNYEAGIALPIAALALFIGLRARSTQIARQIETEKSEEVQKGDSDSCVVIRLPGLSAGSYCWIYCLTSRPGRSFTTPA